MKRAKRGWLALFVTALLTAALHHAQEPAADPQETPSEAGVRAEIDEIKARIGEMLGGIQFGGFFDVTASGYQSNPNVFALGDFELDIAKSVGRRFQVGAAMVFNDEGAQLAVGFIDFLLLGGPISPRGQIFVEKGMHLQVGRFDVPFGNDWLFFASKDRLPVSAPLSTEQVMAGGYNDTGIRVLGAGPFYNLTLFTMRGDGEGVRLGGRLGLTPLRNPYALRARDVLGLEIGLSCMDDLARDGSSEERFLAADLSARFEPLRLQAEWLRRRPAGGAPAWRGGHVTAGLDMSPWLQLPVVLFGRLDGDRVAGGSRRRRFSAGCHWDLFGVARLKAEYRRLRPADAEAAQGEFELQLVIVF